jgi:predicted permease
LTESLLLSVAGGVGGVILAAWSLDFLAILIPEDLTTAALRFDGGIIAFAVALCGLTTIVFGVLPSRHGWRFGVAESLNQWSARGGEHRSAHRLRALLVVSQAALAMMLLVAAGLLVRTFGRLSSVDPGFRAGNVLTMRTALPWYRHEDQKKRDAFYRDVLRRAEALPGVSHAGYVTWLPYTNFGGTSSFLIEGKPEPAPGKHNDANVRLTSPGYFPAMGMTLTRGRFLAGSDATPAAPAVVVNQTMARTFWPGEDALDRRFKMCRDCGWIRIAGIARDLHQKSVDTKPRPEFFVHYSQFGFFAPQDLAIRFTGDAAALANAVRRAVWDVDPQQPIADVKLLTEYLDEDLGPRRFQSQLLGAFAALAVLLASLGIYGVLAYAVAQRRREIGVRLALGAQQREIVRMVISQGVRPALAGLVIGLALSLGLAQLIAALLFGVHPRDPMTFTVAAAILLAVALFAAWLPARRAGSTRLVEALRHE